MPTNFGRVVFKDESPKDPENIDRKDTVTRSAEAKDSAYVRDLAGRKKKNGPVER